MARRTKRQGACAERTHRMVTRSMDRQRAQAGGAAQPAAQPALPAPQVAIVAPAPTVEDNTTAEADAVPVEDAPVAVPRAPEDVFLDEMAIFLGLTVPTAPATGVPANAGAEAPDTGGATVTTETATTSQEASDGVLETSVAAADPELSVDAELSDVSEEDIAEHRDAADSTSSSEPAGRPTPLPTYSRSLPLGPPASYTFSSAAIWPTPLPKQRAEPRTRTSQPLPSSSTQAGGFSWDSSFRRQLASVGWSSSRTATPAGAAASGADSVSTAVTAASPSGASEKRDTLNGNGKALEAAPALSTPPRPLKRRAALTEAEFENCTTDDFDEVVNRREEHEVEEELTPRTLRRRQEDAEEDEPTDLSPRHISRHPHAMLDGRTGHQSSQTRSVHSLHLASEAASIGGPAFGTAAAPAIVSDPSSGPVGVATDVLIAGPATSAAERLDSYEGELMYPSDEEATADEVVEEVDELIDELASPAPIAATTAALPLRIGRTAAPQPGWNVPSSSSHIVPPHLSSTAGVMMTGRARGCKRSNSDEDPDHGASDGHRAGKRRRMYDVA